jgi:hypothetical protein
MSIQYCVGIDPGKTGAICFMPTGSGLPITMATAAYSWKDIFARLKRLDVVSIELEQPGGYIPGNGKKSIKGLFQNLGTWIGILEASGLPYTLLSPQRWMNDLDCRTGGDKKVTYRYAQELYPRIRITHAIADAVLIAHHCRDIYLRHNCEIY